MRRVVQWSAAAIALFGVAVIASLDVPLALRWCAAVAWTLSVVLEVLTLRRGWSTCVAFRVHADGAVRTLGPDGEWSAGQLEPDGVLLRRWGWIRLRTGAGRAIAEPLRGASRECREWRRLQVVWRHVGA